MHVCMYVNAYVCVWVCVYQYLYIDIYEYECLYCNCATKLKCNPYSVKKKYKYIYIHTYI